MADVRIFGNFMSIVLTDSLIFLAYMRQIWYLANISVVVILPIYRYPLYNSVNIWYTLLVTFYLTTMTLCDSDLTHYSINKYKIGFGIKTFDKTGNYESHYRLQVIIKEKMLSGVRNLYDVF